MDWDKLRIFHTVAEVGSFTHAGEALNLSQSAVSRQISALEETLNVTLFHRHARGLILTEQGEVLHKTAHDILGRLTMTVAQISESRERPQGPLKITTTIAFGSVWLAPRMKEFLKRYPDIDVSVVLSDDELDLSMREADVAIRMTPPKQPDLVQRHLMTMHYQIFASPDYIKTNGMPKTVDDLDSHDLITYGRDAQLPARNLNWLLAAGKEKGTTERSAVLRVNNVYGIFRAVQNGIGIGSLPDYMSNDARDLVRVLPEMEGPTLDTFFVYPDELRHSKRITVFRDFLLQKIAESGY